MGHYSGSFALETYRSSYRALVDPSQTSAKAPWSSGAFAVHLHPGGRLRELEKTVEVRGGESLGLRV